LPKEKRFAALSALAKTLIEKCGHLTQQELDSFIAAGLWEDDVQPGGKQSYKPSRSGISWFSVAME